MKLMVAAGRTVPFGRTMRVAVVMGAALALFPGISAGDNLCGARAVFKVLEGVEKPTDVSVIINGLSPRMREEGATVSDVVRFLRNSGLQVTVVGSEVPRFDSRSRIICLADAAPGRSGHYYALEPSEGQYVVWDGYPDADVRFQRSAPSSRVYILVERRSDAPNADFFTLWFAVIAAVGTLAAITAALLVRVFAFPLRKKQERSKCIGTA